MRQPSASTTAVAVALVALSMTVVCCGASPVLLFGPTTDLQNSTGVDSAAIAHQLVLLVMKPSTWAELRSLVMATSGALHMRQLVFSYMSLEQQHVLASLRHQGVQLSLEAGGAMCGYGSGAQAANHTLEAMADFLTAGGRLSYLALESVFSRTHAKCPQQSHSDTASELAEFAAAFHSRLGSHPPKYFLYDALPHFSVGSWPANVPQYDMALVPVLKLLVPAMKARGVPLSGYWADCPGDYSMDGHYPNTTHPFAPGSGYKKVAAAVDAVHSLGLEVGKTFNSQSGGMSSDEAFYNGTLADWEGAAQAVPSPTGGGRGFDYVMVESWYTHPLEAAPEQQPWTTAYTALDVLKAANATASRRR